MFSQFSCVSLQFMLVWRCCCLVVPICSASRCRLLLFEFWSDLQTVACVFVVSDGFLRLEYYFRVVVLICLFLAEKDVGLICFSQGGANQCGFEHF